MVAIICTCLAVLFAMLAGGSDGAELHTTLRTAINSEAAVGIEAQHTYQVQIEVESAERRAADRQQTIRWAIGAVVALGALWVVGRTVPIVLPLLLHRNVKVKLLSDLPPEVVDAHWRVIDAQMARNGYELEDRER
jgi:hypothetical protein